ncbi:MAG: peptide chain release factor-like protein [Pirellulaceae bacterium]
MHPACLPVEELLKNCTLRLQRRSGPGGQHRNKVETAVVIVHDETRIAGEASERRSQADNRRMAVFRLRLALATQLRSPIQSSLAINCDDRPSDGPSELWRLRSANGRIRCAADHEDFPALLAELLDHLARLDDGLTAAATFFDVSSSQLVRLLRQHPPALQMLNASRQQHGLHKLT